MKKRFKKIYIEITNRCNLHCSFCSSNKREFHDMSICEFKSVIDKVQAYTDYVYLHVKGEPLLSPFLDNILLVCDSNNIMVNITTNGVFLMEKMNILMNHHSVRQINISLHCENNKNNYFEDIFECCKTLSTKMFISYRIWNLENLKLDNKSTEIVNKIINSYNLSPSVVEKLNNSRQIKIDINTFVNKDNLFVWPDESNGMSIDGNCYGLKSHIGILSDGSVVPCCLDGNGELILGNIFKSSLEEILESDKCKKIIKGFNENKSVYDLCKNCNFRNRYYRK